MKKNKMMILLIVSSLLAGCADVIPDPGDVYGNEETINKEWLTLAGNFTLITDNNTTMLSAPTIVLDVNSTYGLIELGGFNYTAVHLSFEIINNSVIFHNYTFNMIGHLLQETHDSNYLWSQGYAPEFGNATLHFASFPFDITIQYELEYRIWDGKE
jgi:hypothetical protein